MYRTLHPGKIYHVENNYTISFKIGELLFLSIFCFTLRASNWSTPEKRCHKEKQLSYGIK